MKNIFKLICILTMFYSNIAYADIKFWTTEVQPERMAKQEEMAKSFEAKTGIKVEVIPIEEKDLGTRATAAAASGNLPDVIYHTLQYVLPWAEAGILDVDANNDVVKALGKKYSQDAVITQSKGGGGATLKRTRKGGLPKRNIPVGKMRPGRTGENDTRIKGKTYTYE